jgi:predicted transcriptional regulator
MEQPTKPRGRRRTEAGTPPAYAFRIPKDLRDQADFIAKARGETLPEVVRRALDRYVARHRKHAATEGEAT